MRVGLVIESSGDAALAARDRVMWERKAVSEKYIMIIVFVFLSSYLFSMTFF